MAARAWQKAAMPTPVILLHSALPLRTSKECLSKARKGAAAEARAERLQRQEHPRRANECFEEEKNLERVAQSVYGGGAKALVELEGKEARGSLEVAHINVMLWVTFQTWVHHTTDLWTLQKPASHGQR
jgi:hypothetical protein